MTYCLAAQSLARSAAAMSGVDTPHTSPPLTLETFDPKALTSHAFVYFKLHGLAGQPFWYGDGGITAVSAEQLAACDLRGAHVFAACCFTLDSPMIEALRQTGAAWIVAGAGFNYAGVDVLAGIDVIGQQWQRLIAGGTEPGKAFRMAQVAALLRRPTLVQDIYSFKVMQGKASNASKG